MIGITIIVLAKKLQMCGTPILVGVSRGFRLLRGLTQVYSCEKPCFGGVFYEVRARS